MRGLLGWKEPPRPVVPRPSAAVTGTRGAPLVNYQDASGARPSTQVRYRRETIRVPRLGIEAWAHRATPRQKLLVLGALVSLTALGVSGWQRLRVARELPAAVHGYWVSDDARYAGLGLELRARLVAFKTTDSANLVVVRPIVQVGSIQGQRGQVYRVVYEAEGEPAELLFTFEDGATPELIFEHQPQVTWRRFSIHGTMLPLGF